MTDKELQWKQCESDFQARVPDDRREACVHVLAGGGAKRHRSEPDRLVGAKTVAARCGPPDRSLDPTGVVRRAEVLGMKPGAEISDWEKSP